MNNNVMDNFLDIVFIYPDLSHEYALWVQSVQDVKCALGQDGRFFGFPHHVVPFLRERFVIEKFGSIEGFSKWFSDKNKL